MNPIVKLRASCPAGPDRREVLQQVGLGALALGLGGLAAAEPKASGGKKRVLMYTRSVEFEHGVVHRKDGKRSLAETIATEIGGKHNIEVVCEKDGRVFLSKEFPKFDGFVFETQGNNLAAEKSKDGSPPVPPEGKKALLKAVADGKGFVGCHCASDTYHSRGPRDKNQEPDKRDPYITMLGGEFIVHGRQQKATQHVVDPKFPGLKGVKDFTLLEEWYALKNFAPDLHVILVQETKGMVDKMYQRQNFPSTWARRHHEGRVFFTSMGHRDDVWKNPTFQGLLGGGLQWTLGLVQAEIPPNLKETCPKAAELPGAK
jgi:type 1 glutamine amidotransferase